jgi:competence protein ComEA
MARVNLNTATLEQLDALPGVGPAIAQRIIDSRQAEGPFRQVDDLTRVDGIGAKTLERLREQVTV